MVDRILVLPEKTRLYLGAVVAPRRALSELFGIKQDCFAGSVG
jgi:hypothetical protein